jgi:circadian clock protein KaiB
VQRLRGLGSVGSSATPAPKLNRRVTAENDGGVEAFSLLGAPMERYVIKLYVTGQTPRAQTAIANLRRICEQELGGRYELQVIDVLQRPQLAEDEKILATPMVVKELPPPIRRIIGDLSDTERVLLGLDLRSSA